MTDLPAALGCPPSIPPPSDGGPLLPPVNKCPQMPAGCSMEASRAELSADGKLELEFSRGPSILGNARKVVVA